MAASPGLSSLACEDLRPYAWRPTQRVSPLDQSHHHLDPGGYDLFPIGVDRRRAQQELGGRERDPGGDARPFTFTPEFVAWVTERNFDPFGEWRDIVRGMGIGKESKDWTFLTRIQVGLYSVLGTLRATRDWRAVHDELRTGQAPQTDLGQQHHTWRTART